MSLLAAGATSPARAAAGQAPGAGEETASTVSSVPAAEIDRFTDASMKGREEGEFADKWLRFVTSTYPLGFLVRVKAFDPATGEFTLYQTLPAGTIQPADTYIVGAYAEASPSALALPPSAALLEPLAALSTTTTLTADRTTGIVIPGGGGAAGADGANATLIVNSDGQFFTGAGDGANGSRGGDLTATVNLGPFDIATTGQAGIRAGSVGGDGGDGGSNLTVFVAGGGDGGRGGDGGAVAVTTTSTTGGIVTTGTGAVGIYASSRAGNGGNGGDGHALFVGEGGKGGFGGNGGTVAVNANTAITTNGARAHGIFAQSLGGNGGNGGDGSGLVSGGGAGSGSGNGGRVDVTNSGDISTTRGGAFGVFVQSVGGFAGTGGSTLGFVTFGGGATSGGNGGVARIDNSGKVTTRGFRSHALFAQSVGGNGGSAGDATGDIALGGTGADGGHASTVRIDNHGSLLTTGLLARGIYAQSVGGGGGDGGGSLGMYSFGGSGAAGGNGGQVVVTNDALVVASGDAIFAQSVGGGGGSGGGAISAGFSLGGTGTGGGHGSSVSVANEGALVATGSGARGIFAQSLGGGGGDGGFSGGLVSIGGRGGTSSHGGAVTVGNSGAIASRSSAILAQSVGGGGGNGGLSGGWFSFGGSAGAGGNASTVTVVNTGALGTLSADASALLAQSLGGGGGNGGGSVSIGAFLSVGVGGSGGAGGDASLVDVTSTAPAIVTLGDRSHGIFAQSLGGGGGSGGFAASASIGYIVSASIGKGGAGADGGSGGMVNAHVGGDISTYGEDASGVVAQSIGGGGGVGGWSVAVSGSDTATVSLSFGGAGGGGGSSSAVLLETTGGAMVTRGTRSHGLFAQSMGGGGGRGGFSVAGGFSGAGAGALTMGGSGGGGGGGDTVTVRTAHAIATYGADAYALFAQSLGGGGGAGGISVAAGGAGAAAGGVSIGGSGGLGGSSRMVDVTSAGAFLTFGDRAIGLFAQSMGGGGGQGGFSASGAGAGTGAVSFDLGGSGGGGGHGDVVVVDSSSRITTRGVEAHGLFAQSLGGGGGHGGVSLSGSGAGTGAAAIGIGGAGGGGGTSGLVDVTSRGLIETWGASATGLFAQSLGGGGGRGGFSVSGSGAGTASGSFSLGGTGGGGGNADRVRVLSEGDILTHGEDAVGLFAQSLGGGGGNGGFSLTGTGAGTGSGAIGIGGFGGGGGFSQSVDVVSRGLIETWGARSTGLFAQSTGGGGGSGGFSISGSGAGTGSGSFSLGGAGGGGGNAQLVAVSTEGAIVTHADDATGLFAQSVGGGGGHGGFSVTGSGAGTGSGTMGIGGFGGDGGTGGRVDVTSRGWIETWGIGSTGLLAQSVGGGGGAGRFSVSGSGAGTGSGSFSLGGAGGGGGNADSVWVVSEGAIVTHADDAVGLFAQSVGGGGGNGGFSLTGSGAKSGSGSVGIGGFGGGGGDGSSVTVTTAGSIATSGDGAVALLAQSVGGGGGAGRFSIAGSGAQSGSGTFSLGGAGGLGGAGAAVDVRNAAAIATAGRQAYGLFGQSVGGGGGSGGFSFSGGITTTGGQLNASVGGFGGAGGSAGTVDVFNSAVVTTAASGTHAILAQSLGGGGGAGGFSGSISATGGTKPEASVSIGGRGGVAGDGAKVALENQGAIQTSGRAAAGLFAQSVGGGGGDGGGSLAIAFGTHQGGTNVSIAVGGAGGAAGDGGVVEVDNIAAITTLDARSHGLLAQSLGGGGGTGGFSATGVLGRGTNAKDLSVSVGGVGGSGGAAATVDVDNAGAIAVRGGSASGIFAQSVGGGGGEGGFSFAGSFGVGPAKDGSVAVGGFGGDGSRGGTVTVTNSGAIDVAADMTPEIVRARLAALPVPLPTEEIDELVAALYTARPGPGILAQSIGGGGGAGGDVFALGLGAVGEKKTWALNAAVAVGGFGGDGNAGGTVNVTNLASVTTRGDDSDGLFLQSIGGGGGRGGSARAATATLAAADGNALSSAISVGGFGGAGNTGGEVHAVNSGGILTFGDHSAGIRAQSIGGGGGLGGSAGGTTLMFDVSFMNSSNPGEDLKIQVAVGGRGGSGNHGGVATIDNSAPVATHGAISHGLFAQSIGGGGGSGGDGLGGLGIKGDKVLELADKATGFISDFRNPLSKKVKDALKSFISEWSIAVGGNAGSSGDGSEARVTNSAPVTTFGYGSHAIFAQSIGGGGGEGVGSLSGESAGGKAEAGFAGKVGIGGAGGAAGNGGVVVVVNSGRLTTSGESAYGILAQSVGGGGGVAGNVERALPEARGPVPALNIGLGVDFGRDGGGAGDGGRVTVTNTGDIRTTGDGASGIVAQSVGGGGGLAGGIGLLSQAASTAGPVNFAGSVGGDGSGGSVSVNQTGTIVTRGAGADGIFAQSAGGMDVGGSVTVNLTGSLFATGAGSHGILAQSRGDLAAGNITVTLRGGTVLGGPGATAVSVVEGAVNTVSNHGTITTVGGVGGTAVRGTSGHDAVVNFGTLVGSIELGAGGNTLINMPGARFDSGARVDLGPGHLFTNGGLFSPGGGGVLQTTTLIGDFLQTGAPAWLVDLGDIGISDSLAIAGSARPGQSAATVDLNMLAAPVGSGAYTLLSASGGGLTGAGLRFGSLFGAMPIGRTFAFSHLDTAVELTLSPSTGPFYWRGAASGVWSSPFVNGASNWTRTPAAGDYVFGTPGAASDVIFPSGGSTTALGADFTVRSLTFAGGSSGGANTIAAGHTLTLGGGRGITVEAGASGATIGVDLVLGANQQWTNHGGHLLAIVGDSITGDGRHLTISGTGPTRIDAAIRTGSGSLTKEGTGTLLLAGSNDYRGGTTVTGGVLLGDARSLQGDILNDAIVVFDQAGTGTYAGTMSGAGTLYKQNEGRLILSGPNTYRGGTAVTGGVLQGDALSLQGDVLNDAAVVFDQADAGTYAGRLYGEGLLRKQGTGALTLTGQSGRFAGNTIVGAGQLVVDGVLGGGSLLVAPGALLGGTGVVPAATLEGGAILSPGNSIGTLGVAGDLRFEADATYRVEVAADGSSDLTIATGSADLGGATVEILAEGDGYDPITRYPILLAEGGLTGAFAGATSSVDFLQPSFDPGTGLLQLTLRRTDVNFGRHAPGGGAGAVAGVLNALVMTATGPMADVVNAVYGMSGDDALRAMRSMAGGHYQHVASGALADSRMFVETSLTRLGRRAIEGRGSETGTAFARPLAAAAATTLTGADWVDRERASGWWIRGLAGSSSLAAAGTDLGASVPTRGVVVGFDRAVTRRLILGVSGGRTDPEVRQEGSFDQTTARMLHAGLYGSYRYGPSRVDAGLSGGHQEYRTRREVFAGGSAAVADADYDGRSYLAHVEYGYGIGLGRQVGVEAEVGLQAAGLHVDRTAESGAGVLSLVVAARRIESRRSMLGGRVRVAFGPEDGAGAVIEGRAAWVHEFNAREGLPARFTGDELTEGFLVPAIGLPRNAALLGASVHSDRWERLRLFADVTSEIGRPSRRVAGSLGFGWRW